jgi:hypothetical protein
VAYDAGEMLTIIGGLHGIGTRATIAVLESRSVLERLIERTEQYKYWSAMFSISYVHHPGVSDETDRSKHSIPCGIDEAFAFEPV